MTRAYHIRPATPGERPALANLMAASIRALGPQHYTPAQVDVWAAAAHDRERFPRLVDGAFTLVAEDGGGLVGFGALKADGHLSALYIDGQHTRRGIAMSLLQGLLEHAARTGMEKVHTEASEFSRPVFEKAGFRLDAMETVERNGVALHRARMSLPLPKRD